MSLWYRSEPFVSVVPGYPHCKVSFMTGDAWLRNHGLHAPDSEDSQALRRVPTAVRLAIASHFTWWFLARAHSAVVRTFAHSFFSACRSPMSALSQAYQGGVNDSCAQVGVIGAVGPHQRSLPVMPYRVLHYFGRYLQDIGAAGHNSNNMNKKEWNQSLRPGVRPYSEYRNSDHDKAPGCIGSMAESDYGTADYQGGMVRSSLSRWTDFKAGAITAMQPFFSAGLRPDGLGDEFGAFPSVRATTVPKLMIDKPRSKKMVAMIPRALAYGMEQVGEELPYCVRWVHGNSDWSIAVKREIKHYLNQREEAALLAMSQRDPIATWLRQYDTIAAINYGMPAVEGRNVGMSVSNIKFNASSSVFIKVPGICENNLG